MRWHRPVIPAYASLFDQEMTIGKAHWIINSITNNKIENTMVYCYLKHLNIVSSKIILLYYIFPFCNAIKSCPHNVMSWGECHRYYYAASG